MHDENLQEDLALLTNKHGIVRMLCFVAHNNKELATVHEAQATDSGTHAFGAREIDHAVRDYVRPPRSARPLYKVQRKDYTGMWVFEGAFGREANADEMCKDMCARGIDARVIASD